MKLQITYRLFYADRNITKIVNVDRVLDKTQAENLFRKWARAKFKNAKKIEILEMFEIEKDATFEKLKEMFKMN